MAKQGRAIYGVDMKIVDDDGKELPWDGEASGELLVRGPWIIEQLLQGARAATRWSDGWFPTGDVAKHRRRRLHADHRPQQGRDQVAAASG